jgi:hypothetical protein
VVVIGVVLAVVVGAAVLAATLWSLAVSHLFTMLCKRSFAFPSPAEACEHDVLTLEL